MAFVWKENTFEPYRKWLEVRHVLVAVWLGPLMKCVIRKLVLLSGLLCLTQLQLALGWAGMTLKAMSRLVRVSAVVLCMVVLKVVRLWTRRLVVSISTSVLGLRLVVTVSVVTIIVGVAPWLIGLSSRCECMFLGSSIVHLLVARNRRLCVAIAKSCGAFGYVVRVCCVAPLTSALLLGRCTKGPGKL